MTMPLSGPPLGRLQAEGFDIVGEATDGVEAVEAVAVLRPEIVLLDIQHRRVLAVLAFLRA